MGNKHDFESFKRSAQEIVDTPLDTLPDAQNILAQTQEKKNVLKLSMYSNTISGHGEFGVDASAEEIAKWIYDNPKAFQLFLLALGADLGNTGPDGNGADGDIGTKTVNAAEQYLGLHLTHDPHFHNDVEGLTSYELPDYLQDETQIRGVLASLGITGVEIVDGKLVGINEIEIQDKIKKLEKYLDFMNYIELFNGAEKTTQAEAQGKMSRYKELLSDTTKYIQDKEYLIQKYAISINQDILDEGFIVQQKDIDGAYEIVPIVAGTATTDVIQTYQEFVTGNASSKAFIEFARVYNIVASDTNPRFHERNVTREGMVMHILQNNSILSNYLVPEIQSIEALLIDKESVLVQLKEKAGTLTEEELGNPRQYQELFWLIDFLEHENYKQDDIQRDLFNRVNHHKNVFDAEKSFLDALTAEGIDPNEIDPNNNDVMSRVERVFKGNRVILYALGIAMMLFGGTRKWGVGLILTTTAIGAGISIADDTIDEVQDSGGITGDAFDMFDPYRLKHRVNYPDGFDRDNYDPTLDALFRANDARRKDGEISSGVAQLQTTNAHLALIFQGIMNKDDLLTQDLNSTNITTLAETIHKGLDDKTINAEDFDSRIASDQEGDEISKNDVRVFLELLMGQASEGEDTIHEAMLDGESILSESYDVINFTGDQYFNAALNNHLLSRWEANTPSDSLSITNATNGRKEIQEAITRIQTSLSSGTFDGVFDWGATLNWDNFSRNSIEQISIIDALISDISSNSNISDNTKNPLIEADTGLLPKLQIYIEGKDTLASLEGTTGIIETVKGWTIGNTESELIDQSAEIDQIITQLNPSAFAINGTTIDLTSEPLYTNLVQSIEMRKRELQTKKAEVSARLLEIMTHEREKVLLAKQNINDAVAIFTNSNKVIDIIPVLETNYPILKDAWDNVSGTTPVAGSPEEELKAILKPLFKNGGEFEALQTSISVAFSTYFEANQAVIDNEITTIKGSFTDISTALSALNALRNIEGRFNRELGMFTRFTAFISGTTQRSETEKLYSTSQSIFPGLSATNDTATLANVAQEAVNKEEAIALAIFNHVNSLNVNSITANEFATLDQMRSLDIIPFVNQSQPNSNFGALFAQKYSQSATLYLQSMPATQAGITKLRNFETLYINTNPSIIEWIAGFWSSDAITPAFEAQVSIVASNILRTDFTENEAGLQKILAFRSSPEYDFIKSHGTNFETSYENRVKVIADQTLINFGDTLNGLSEIIRFKGTSHYRETTSLIGRSFDSDYDTRLDAIRNSIISSTSTNDTRLIVSGTSTLNDVVSSNAQRLTVPLLSSFITRSRTIQELINEFDLNPPISGAHNGVDQIARTDLYNALVALNLK